MHYALHALNLVTQAPAATWGSAGVCRAPRRQFPHLGAQAPKRSRIWPKLVSESKYGRRQNCLVRLKSDFAALTLSWQKPIEEKKGRGMRFGDFEVFFN